MSTKKRLNHALYLKVLRRMTAEERLQKSFELSEFCRKLFLDGLRKRFPDMSDTALRQVYLERLNKCHNRNY